MTMHTAQPNPIKQDPAKKDVLHRLRRIGHYTLRLFTIVIIITITAIIIGFFRFTDTIANLKPADNMENVDAIVVLTGGYQRISKALSLLESGIGKRLLISGVNPATSSEAIRRATGAKSATFNCCVDIGYQALDTIGNGNETAAWIRKRGYKRVLVVTNNYHIPRSLLELSQASPDVKFLPHPVSNANLKDDTWLSDPLALRTLFTEYAKYCFARLRNWTGAKKESGLRTVSTRNPPLTASLHSHL